jgi:hypothetical protein
MGRTSQLFVLAIALFLLPAASGGSQSGLMDPRRVEVLREVQERNENRVLAIPGVVGIGIGPTQDGKGLAFIVYVEKLTPEMRGRLPVDIEGIPVRLYESGIIKAY